MLNQKLNDEFSKFYADLSGDKAKLDAFLADPVPQLHAAGFPVLPTRFHPPIADPAAQSFDSGASNPISVNTCWWGIEIVMDEATTQGIISGGIALGPLVSLIQAGLIVGGVLAGPVAIAFAAGTAAAIIVKAQEIRVIDNGNGVYWPISWLQWAALIPILPLGPASVSAWFVALVHPLRN